MDLLFSLDMKNQQRIHPTNLLNKERGDILADKKSCVTVTRLPDGTFQFHGTSKKITEAKNKALEPYGYELWCYGLRLMILPTKEQQTKLNSNIGCARVVHNDYIAKKKEAYVNKEPPVTHKRYCKELLPASIT